MTNKEIGWRLFWIVVGLVCWMIAVFLVAEWFQP